MDRAYELTEWLQRNTFRLLDIFPTELMYILTGILSLTTSSRAWKYAKSLASSDLVLGNVLVDHNFLINLIKDLDNSTKHGYRNSTKHRYIQCTDKTVEDETKAFSHILASFCLHNSQILLNGDVNGRTPLHYSGIYGLVTICHSILEFLHDQQADISEERRAVLTADNEGLTPLHCSILHGHIETTKLLLAVFDTDGSNISAAQYEHLRRTLSGLLLIALKHKNSVMVCLLLASGHIDMGYQSNTGETALHVAAETGYEEFVRMILEAGSRQGIDIDIRENFHGWTALFIACVRGFYSVAELLLQAGACGTLTDILGWAAKEHAIFRGHLPVAELRGMRKATEVMTRPAHLPSMAKNIQKYHLQAGCTYVLVNLGVLQDGRQTEPVSLHQNFVRESGGAHPDGRLSLEISTSAGSHTSHLIRLPLLDDPIDDSIVLPVDNFSDASLNFKLLSASVSSTGEPSSTLVGSGIFLLQDDRKCFGAQHETLIREHRLPILGAEAINFLGTVTFSYVLAKPFPHLMGYAPSLGTIDKPDSVQLVGHRGLGQNLGDSKYLQAGENTVESFLSAVKLGASYVEFDVQITRDLVPILYHDFSLSESGTDVPIHDLTLSQFMYTSNVQSPQDNQGPMVGVKQQTSYSSLNRPRPRSRSLTQDQEKGAREVRDRIKYTVDFTNKGFKPNTRGDFIQGSFATLEEAFRKVPESISFDMEIKYPCIHEAVEAGVAPVTIDLNTFIDTILTIIVRFAGTRKIILSSFTPEVCILLTLKQQAYPAMFITNAGKRPVTDREVRAGSLQVAVRFANQWGLAGIVLAADAFVMCPRLIAHVKSKGLVCGSYGPLNNVPGNIELQVKAGIDLVIADRVGLIAKILKSLSDEGSSRSS